MDNQTLFEMDTTPAPLLPLPAPRRVERYRKPERPANWSTLQAQVFERDGWICQCCGRLCAPQRSTAAKRGHWATVDHVVPRSMGGWDELVNLQTLCARCNDTKGDRIIDYRSDVRLRLALDQAREARGLVPEEMRTKRGGIQRGAEKLSVVLTCRVTATEAAALEARYGSRTYAARAGVDRLLYAG